MSKIICDVCGTSYQESAMQCPICGCVRPGEVLSEADINEARIDRAENYTYVKGGRFSRANVQKRNQGVLRDNAEKIVQEDVPQNPKSSKGDKGLVIAVCALLLAIVAVVIYIVFHFFAQTDNTVDKSADSHGTTTAQTTENTQASTGENIACTDIVLSQTEVTLTTKGAVHSLDFVLTPEDATDDVRFVSEDESVATVSKAGDIVAVSAGETVVTVTCGTASAQCRVVCDIEDEIQQVATEPTISSEEFRGPFKLNKASQQNDVMIKVGESFLLKLLDADKKVVPVSWEVKDPDICSVDGNSIKGTAKGTTEVFVTYEGETYTCTVRVR